MDADRMAMVNALRQPQQGGGFGDWLSGQFSLDTPQQDLLSPQTAGDMALGMVPGVGQAMAVRDMARGIKAGDPWQVAGGAAGLIPFGKLVGALRGPMHEIIAGQNAARFPAQAASEGMDALRAGASPSKVWAEHGIEKTAQGAPSWEISDFGTKLNPEKFQQVGGKPWDAYHGTVGDVLDHPELYANYPELQKMGLRMHIDPTDTRAAGGAYYHWGEPGSKTGEPMIHVNAPDLESAHSVLLHELQHGTQALEGWAGGGNPEALTEKLISMKQKAGLVPSTGDPGEAEKIYLRLMGENQSNAVQERAKIAPEFQRMVTPQESSPFPYGQTIDPADVTDYMKAMVRRLKFKNVFGN